MLSASAVRRGGFDELIVRGQGAYLWTAGGRRLVDYFLSHGTTVVGHGDPAVNDAAALAAACCGRTGVGLQRGEVELAEQIAAWLPSAEKVAFVAGGGEALRQAIEVSRAATGRHRILTSDIGDPGAATAFARHGVNRLHELGVRLRERLRGAIHDARVDATVTGSGPAWRLAWGAADSGHTRAFGAAVRDAGVLLPLSPLTACHVCLATSADDIDEMIAAAAHAFRQHTSQPQRRSP